MTELADPIRQFHSGTSAKKPAKSTHPIRYTGNRDKHQPHHARSENATKTVAFCILLVFIFVDGRL
jgi:hypothetical protein